MTAGLTECSDEQFVQALYRNLLRREPDRDGARAMLRGLSRGGSRLEAIDMVLRSEEFLSWRRALGFAAPGHFYSPHPGSRELQEHRAFDWDRNDLPGVDLREAQQLQLLETLAVHFPELPFGEKPCEAARYGYDNTAYSWGDGVLLFCMVQHLRPRRIVEVGSGHSSCAILDALDHAGRADARATFIEPYPDLLRNLLRPGDLDRHELRESRLQDCPLSIFQELEPGDILFVDSSHVSKLGSDVNRFVFEILPALRRGVFVHVHDIFHPFEYPLHWFEEGRAWNEAYVLRAFLQFNEAFRIELASTYLVSRHRAWFVRHMPLMVHKWGGSQLWMSRAR